MQNRIVGNGSKKGLGAQTSSPGFTLIELLVVISIVGTLSTIALTSLNAARTKARDTQRLSDAEQIRLALELYKTDHGNFPGNVDNDSGGADIGYMDSADTFIQPLVTDGLFSRVPGDPTRQNASGYWYYRYPAGAWGNCDPSKGDFYIFNINFETSNFNAKKPGFTCPAGASWGGHSWNGWGVFLNE